MIRFVNTKNKVKKVKLLTKQYSARLKQKETPVISVVTVRFLQNGRELPYYNDKFDLHEGDIVYVDGKFVGMQARVISVTTHFKIDLSIYKKVVAKLNYEVHGAFTQIGPFMMSFGKTTLTPKQFESWAFPPKEVPTEYAVGDGYIVEIGKLDDCDFIDYDVYDRGIDYIKEGKIKFISVTGTKGEAIVKGTRWYKLNFEMTNGFVKNLSCECPYPGFCKHEVALCVALDIITNDKEFKTSFAQTNKFVAVERGMFCDLAIQHAKKITI